MDIQEIINGRLGVSLGYALGRVLPPGAAKSLAGWLGPKIAGRKSLGMVRACQINQWVVGGESYSSAELDQAVAASFTKTTLSIYRFYRHFRDPLALEKMVEFPEKLAQLIQECVESKSGLIIAGVHLGNFDLVMQAIARKSPSLPGGSAIALSAPNPGRGYEWQNEIRRKSGLEVIPASLSAIKLAVHHLEQGGIVVTGLDRPLPEARYKPKFFNRQAAVPVLHVPLGLRTQSPLVVTGAVSGPDGRYHIFISDFLHMKPYSDRNQEILINAESVLEVAESYIRHSPAEWAMYYPVWPQVLSELPF